MRKLLYLSILILLWSCGSEDDKGLDSADERRQAAIDDLQDKLMAAEHGWVLNYQPVPGSGVYYILLDFDEDEVRIQSDVADMEGRLFDQTIPYRVDVQLAVQLTFETYAVFHYLFEQDQSTFGAEFEFFYLDEQDGNIRLYSKSDGLTEITIATLVPAAANADQAFSREEAGNFDSFDLYNQPFGDQVIQQLYLSTDDVSVFWTIDLTKRIIRVDGAAPGQDSKMITAASWVDIDQEIPYSFLDGKMVLANPIVFNLGGKSYSISEIALDSYTEDGTVYCSSEAQNAPSYTASVAGVGAAELKHSLFDAGGLNFTTEADIPYSVNVFFVGDSTGQSLTADDRIIGQTYPDATGFIFNYGRDSVEIAYSVGISFIDENNVGQTHLRGFDATVVEGNFIKITLNDTFHYTNAAEVEAIDEQNLRDVTDEIFSQGEIYIANWPIQDGLVIFRLFNPCNGYEVVLVKP
ncbi:DUF4302 domain-containing protein [Reichenbachiella agarivorans]|uniref:DUF4302 domain-containing protein n=1 Tax=Reichenbachiella agarivorans TaxID=2979464 RepID=A0ABY6CLZ2_9BACT|nr:DUF4302 domain-containing protein [Reichenbachiella agarivorans]UXP31414.1 DUF4302 domain-containing protein [Reichenbachiella agarivorans]